MSYEINEGKKDKLAKRRSYSVGGPTSPLGSPAKGTDEEDVDILKPATHVLTRESSDVGEFKTQLELRRLSKMHNFLVNHE